MMLLRRSVFCLDLDLDDLILPTDRLSSEPMTEDDLSLNYMTTDPDLLSAKLL